MSVLNFPNVRHESAARCEVPAAAMAAQSLPRVDYADAFEAGLPDGAGGDAVAWSRAIFDKRSPAVALLLGAIGFGLGATAPSPESAVGVVRIGSRSLGFNVWRQADDAAGIEMLTWLGLVQIVITVDADPPRPRVVLSTFIAFSGPRGRAAFTHVVGPAHRRVVPLLMARAMAARG
jgi:hypothetical protein